MKIPALHGLAAVIALAASSTLSAAVLTFDDLGQDGTVPAHYGGLDWSAAGWFAFSIEQEPYTAHSGAVRVATDFAAQDQSSIVRFATPTRFDGAWFAGLNGATVTFQLYRDDVLVATSSTLDPGATPAFLATGYEGLVDAFVVASPEHGSFVMDDVTFAPVPEPSEVALLALGISVLTLRAARGRRRSQTAR